MLLTIFWVICMNPVGNYTTSQHPNNYLVYINSQEAWC